VGIEPGQGNLEALGASSAAVTRALLARRLGAIAVHKVLNPSWKDRVQVRNKSHCSGRRRAPYFSVRGVATSPPAACPGGWLLMLRAVGMQHLRIKSSLCPRRHRERQLSRRLPTMRRCWVNGLRWAAMRCDAMCSASSRRTDAAADVDARLFNGGDRTALESVYLHYDDYLRRTHRCAGLGLSGPLPHRHRRSGSLAPTNGLGAGP